MIRIVLVSVFILSILVRVQSITQNCKALYDEPVVTVPDAFRKSEILNDLNLEVPESGMGFISVQYGRTQATCGNELSLTDTLLPPKVDYYGRPESLNAFIMVDPDVPSPKMPIGRSLLHWMFINVPRSDLASGLNVAPYLPPTPPPATGPHRYIFMAFEQPERISIDVQSIVRTNFNVSKWVKDHSLYGPIAGNYFFEEFLSIPGNQNSVKPPPKFI